MNPASIKKAAARAEMSRRQALAMATMLASFSYSVIADGHAPQLRLMTDVSRNILALCSRRAGKTFAMATILLATARANPNSNSIYIALTRGQAKRIMWLEIWKPLCAKWGVPPDCHNEADLATTLPNGARVYFTGSDDSAHIETYLGAKFILAILDECQAARRAVLQPLVERILPPALSDVGGRMILAGTIPESPAGYFWEQWKSGVWSNHNWSRFENPHLKDQQQMLADFLRISRLPPDDPLVLRDWYGKLVFDATALAFRYDKDRNGFAPGHIEKDTLGKWITHVAPPEIIKLCDQFSVGGDQGKHDRNVLEVNGWSSKHRDVYQVYEFATTENHGGAWSAFGPRLDEIRKLFGDCRHFFDFGGSKLTMDNFRTDHGVYVLQAAKKVDRKGQVDRVNELYQQARKHLMWGTALEGDCLTTKWDKDGRAKGQWEWSGDNHPDAGDADRYSVQGYFDGYVEPEEPKTQAELAAEEVRRILEESEDEAPWFEKDLDNLLPDGGSTLW